MLLSPVITRACSLLCKQLLASSEKAVQLARWPGVLTRQRRRMRANNDNEIKLTGENNRRTTRANTNETTSPLTLQLPTTT